MPATIFSYGETELAYLAAHDKRMASAIERIGPIERECFDDLFEAVVNSIIGQQISTKAHRSIWKRIKEGVGTVDAPTLLELGPERLQAFGTTWRKVDYILDFARRVDADEFDLEGMDELSDSEVVERLVSLRGVGVWTAEMLLLFCLQRPDVLSYGDLGIQRGIRMLYRHRELEPERFERYRRRFSPYGSVASLYLWEIAAGALPELTDPAAR